MKNSFKCVLPQNVTTRVTYLGTTLSRKFIKIRDKTEKCINMILFIVLNVQEVSSEEALMEKRHESCQEEYLTIMVGMLNLIW